MQGNPVRGEEFSGDLEEVRKSQPRDELLDDRDACNDLWSIEGNFRYRHRVGPRVQLYVPQEESFPKPLRYIDVVRTTQTTLGVLQECRKDDYGNIDANRNLSEPWTVFTQFTMLSEKPPDGQMWSGRRLTQIQATTGPDHLWPEIWSSMSKAAQRKEQQHGAIEKPKLDTARMLRGIKFSGPDDKEFKETI